METAGIRAAAWVGDAGDCERAMARISNFVSAGYDSEFDGVDIRTQSCVGRARIDVFSIAVPSGPLDPRGFRRTESWVFDGALITHPEVVSWLENPAFTKLVHNLPVDAHAAYNHGVKIRGGLNTLELARWVWPERAQLVKGNFDLGSLCMWKVGFGKTEDFSDLFMYDAQESYQVMATLAQCSCGVRGCRKRKAPHDGPKTMVEELVTRTKKVRRIVPLCEVRLGRAYAHLFERYVAYAAADAELASVIYDMLLIDGNKPRPFPWAPAGF